MKDMLSVCSDHPTNSPKKVTLGIELPESGTVGLSEKNDHFLQYLLTKDKIVVLSPHLDDAVLSAGSLISYLTHASKNVQIITVFTEGSKITSPAIKTILTRVLKTAQFTDIKAYFEERRKEDMRALRELNVYTTQYLGYTDAAWRIDPNGKAIYPNTQLAGIHAHDALLTDQLSEEFKKIMNYSNIAVLAPIGRGNHVDHQLVRNVVSKIFPNTIFYQDFPYSVVQSNENAFIEKKKLVEFEWRGDYQSKKNAILQYATQLNSLSLFFKENMKLSYEKYLLPKTLK